MILTVASFKGGVGKTVTSVHLAAYLQQLGRTILFDSDATKNATRWSGRGAGFPFPVEPIESAAMMAQQYEHKVIDTGQRPSDEGLKAAAKGSDLLIIPTSPSALDVDGLGQTIRALNEMGVRNYRVLLTKVAPDASVAAAKVREILANAGAPTFWTSIPRLKAYEKAADCGAIVGPSVDRHAGLRAWLAYQCVGEELGR